MSNSRSSPTTPRAKFYRNKVGTVILLVNIINRITITNFIPPYSHHRGHPTRWLILCHAWWAPWCYTCKRRSDASQDTFWHFRSVLPLRLRRVARPVLTGISEKDVLPVNETSFMVRRVPLRITDVLCNKINLDEPGRFGQQSTFPRRKGARCPGYTSAFSSPSRDTSLPLEFPRQPDWSLKKIVRLLKR